MSAAETRARIARADAQHYAKPVPKPRRSHAQLMASIAASQLEEAS